MVTDIAEKKGFAEGFWSSDDVKDIFLEQQRQFMWNMDYWRSIIVPLMNLKPDSTILDVGCGLGFIGQNLAAFVPKGKVVGVDLDAKLVESARKKAEHILPNHAFDYRVGSVYELPIDSESADLAICQCLLMHLENPAKAVSEMKRATKRGGRIVCIEPDFATLSYFDTAAEQMNYTAEQRTKFWRWELLRKLGKRELGKGDDDVGTKLPYLFFQNGLRVVDVRNFDRVFWLIPPYDKEFNNLELQQQMLSPEFCFDKLDTRKEFIAGGGTEEEYKEYLDLLMKEHEIRMRQIKGKTYISSTAQSLVITIGEKI